LEETATFKDGARGVEPRYRTIRELGRGGMGSVDLVYDAEREEEVARKRILEPSAPAIVRFKREFRAIEQLRHEGLVALYELDEGALGTYFTMEYVPGETLTAYCQQRGFGAQELSAASRVQATESVVVTGTAPVVRHATPRSGDPARDDDASNVPRSRPLPSSGPLRARCDWGRHWRSSSTRSRSCTRAASCTAT
jgi:aminoglycoside phosphotransferase (APT) family kinase protein